MLLKNLSRRLITINTGYANRKHPETGDIIKVDFKKTYDLLPAGPAVNVPDKICDTNYVQFLIASGDISAEEAEDPTEEMEELTGNEDNPLMDLEKEELHAMAVELKIDVKARWNKTQLCNAIKKATAELAG